MPEPIWVAELRVSDYTARKITSLHGLQVEELRDAVECVEGLVFTWDDDPDRGRRAILRVSIRGVPVLVVLYPAGHPLGDVWNLGSAYRV